ncbi:TetR/AcrR family transcriptional regulator [Paludibaculum fermentans]|uniref:TetR/AcrR family transcriptional regulator n=1 Tax=Paludibaculum fermentans TaxID=1473598 RepID=A0A7S7SK78_PALFE|nr:TetR/AcrR family transcriptional regulator [Paludibaculum fermentans]QOY87186.1 TetR/AcrR family transcriptional regulator [Paludibaculum fermentans]
MARTRSDSAHRKVLDAALALFAERGIDGTSMDSVAEQSGVSKATIYKHWADKDALILEVMADINGLNARPSFDTGDTRADVRAVLAYRNPEGAEVHQKFMPHCIAYSARNPEFGLAWRHMVMEPPRRELRHLLGLGVERGELEPDLDIEGSLALLLGPVLYWYIFFKGTKEKPTVVAERVVDAFWRAYGVKVAGARGKAKRAKS